MLKPLQYLIIWDNLLLLALSEKESKKEKEKESQNVLSFCFSFSFCYVEARLQKSNFIAEDLLHLELFPTKL